MQEGGRFRLRGKRLFLTYPRCAIAKEEILAHFTDKFGGQLDAYVIAGELHQNGEDHRHVFLELNVTYESRDQNDLNLRQDGQEYHGNY